MRTTQLILAVSLFMIATLSVAEEKTAAKKAGSPDAAYIAQSLSAAPRSIAKDAGVVRFDKDGKAQTLRESKNGFTCLVMMGNKMCGDANSMEFFGAMMSGKNPPEKLGLTYMLRGDDGASNTDPSATKKTADNHWVVTGPHVMLVGPAAKSLGLPDSADADPSKPYLMWASTPYAHAMIPVTAGAAKPASETKEMKMKDMKDMKDMK